MRNIRINIPEKMQKKAVEFMRKHYFPRWMVFMLDNIAVLLTFYLAYLLRFNFVIDDFSHIFALRQSILVVSIYMLFAFIFRPYSGLIRHTTIIDIFNVLLYTSFSMLTLFVLSLISRKYSLNTHLIVPLSIILIHYFLLTMFLFLVRITIKIFYQLITSSYIEKKKLLIYGAGAMGVIVKRVIQSDIKGGYHIAGFIDQNKNLQGKKLNGIPVYSPKSLSHDFLSKHKIESLVFAIKDISPAEKSEIIRTALDVGLEVLDTPPVESWLNGQLQMRQIQKVQLKDLLGRDPIELNIKRIGIGLRGKTILVTGAAGSIGSEIVRQLMIFPIKHLVLVDVAETPMYHIENELRAIPHAFSIHFILADITSSGKMQAIFEEYQPEIIFHAAAYKHVPLMEENPHEALRVNVGGTLNLIELSIKYNIKKFVMISTDKAVNPTNVMGASKRLCEMMLQIRSRQADNKIQFVITRFGNVLGSNGSVIPLFTKQIEEGGPVTVTDPEVTRYFMTIPEACQLVLEAGFMGKGGEIFVFDMGRPIKIVDLAHQMIRLSGLVPDKDIKIVFTGLRPGEKLYEELLTNNENTLPTHNPKIKIAKIEEFDDKEICQKIEKLLFNLYSFSKTEIIKYLEDMVPEFKSNNMNYIKSKSDTVEAGNIKQNQY